MKEMAAQIGKAVGDAFEGDALAYLISVYKDPLKPETLRIDAAKAAIRYERPALAPVEQVTESGIVVLNERLKANRQTGGEAFLYRNCLRSARLIAEPDARRGQSNGRIRRSPTSDPGEDR